MTFIKQKTIGRNDSNRLFFIVVYCVMLLRRQL